MVCGARASQIHCRVAIREHSIPAGEKHAFCPDPLPGTRSGLALDLFRL